MDIATVDELLTTTRSVRKRLDLNRNVEPEIIQRCLEIAVQAPTDGNIARYHFIVVTAKETREQIAEIYRKAYYGLWSQGIKNAATKLRPQDKASFDYLADHLHKVPVHIFACVGMSLAMGSTAESGCELNSIIPATWSLMLALRARGIGSAFTTVQATKKLHAQETAALLGIPDNVRLAVLLPVAYFTGAGFKKAIRTPAKDRTYWDSWGQSR